MPELPEVETVKRTLQQLVAGKQIERVSVKLDRIIQHPPDPRHFAELLKGCTIRSVERRAKYLRFVLDDQVLLSHLRMEGRYGVYQADEPVEKHTHVIFHFSDGTELRYKDVRQFGTMHLFIAGEEWESPQLARLGAEPLSPEFTYLAFKEAIRGKTAKIKPLLLDQTCVAGLGNIYVDEALFKARIHPERTADELSAQEMKRLHGAIVDTLREAVDAGGSSIKSYVNGQGEMGMFQMQLKVYGRDAEPCPRCGRELLKMKVGGRGTHYCRKCQPLRRSMKQTRR